MNALLDIYFDLVLGLLSRRNRYCTFFTFRFSTRIVYGMLQFSGRSLFAACSSVTESVLPICFAQFGAISHFTILLSSCSIPVACHLSVRLGSLM